MKYILIALLLLSFNASAAEIFSDEFKYTTAQDGRSRLIVERANYVMKATVCSIILSVNNEEVATLLDGETITLSVPKAENTITIKYSGGWGCPANPQDFNVDSTEDSRYYIKLTYWAGKFKFLKR